MGGIHRADERGTRVMTAGQVVYVPCDMTLCVSRHNTHETHLLPARPHPVRWPRRLRAHARAMLVRTLPQHRRI